METTFTVEYDPLFSARVPHTRTLLIEADVNDTPTSDQQKQEIGRLASEIAGTVAVDRINSVPAIAATRAAYKACGKDPNRYRPSQEQLMRRIVRGLGLYNVSSLVDAGNQLSLLTGCSVGCFDADKVDGRTLTLGIGREGEPYTGIGRGELNIAGLPVFRDAPAASALPPATTNAHASPRPQCACWSRCTSSTPEPTPKPYSATSPPCSPATAPPATSATPSSPHKRLIHKPPVELIPGGCKKMRRTDGVAFF